jgi:hypothetical protein
MLGLDDVQGCGAMGCEASARRFSLMARVCGGVVSVLVGALALGALGCGDEASKTPVAARLPDHIDAGAFRYGPLRAGSPGPDVVAWLGAPAKDPYGYNNANPAGQDDDDIGSPNVSSFPPHSRDHALRYRGVTVLVSYRTTHYRLNASSVYALVITAAGTRTERGVGVGSSLRDVAARYPTLDCGQAGTGEFGYYPYCGERIAKHRWLWFGQNPVRSIMLSTEPLGL